MKIEGTYQISAPRERVFEALTDPAILQKCIPGCERLEKAGENRYNATLSAGVGPIKGTFSATVAIENMMPPSNYRLVVEGKGQPGFIKGTGDLILEDHNGGTLIRYTGNVQVGGMLASVGQRMIESTAKMLAGKFFSALEAELRSRPPQSGAA
jgi:carbon monoxide dehydrogenase subunit G